MNHYLIFASPSWPLQPQKGRGAIKEAKDFQVQAQGGEDPTLEEHEDWDTPFMDNEEGLVFPEDEDSDDD